MFMFNDENSTVPGEDEEVLEETSAEVEEPDAADPDEGTDDGWPDAVDLPWWRRRRFLLMAGLGVAAAVVVVALAAVLLGGGGDAGDAGGADETAAEIDFSAAEVDQGPVAGDVDALGAAIAALEPADRVALLTSLGMSEEAAASVAAPEQGWRLNRDAADLPTNLKPWARHAMTSGLMSGVGSGEGGATLGLVAKDVLASLGPAVWPMVQADQTLRRIFTQSLVDWDYWGTQSELLVLETYLNAAAEASLDVERRVGEAEFGLSAQTRQYVRDALAGLEPLLQGRDIAVQVNSAFADGRSWDTLEPTERSRLGRLAGQEIFESLSEFDRVMMRYGCSVCGELYRNPPDASPTSALVGEGALSGGDHGGV